MFFLINNSSIIGAMAILFYMVGIACAVLALWRSRTPQGAAAWVVALLSFPFLSVPLFLVFGRNKFFGYVKRRMEYDHKARKELAEIESIFSNQVMPSEEFASITASASKSMQPGFTDYNKAELLIDGAQTYEHMFKEIEEAQKYILVQFYIFRCDEIGQKFIDLLIKKAKQGIKVYLLCDKVGTKFTSAILKKMSEAGVEFSYFYSTKNWGAHFQINFRNHRKNLVVDGKTAFVGGLNIGDDYLGKWPSIGSWRDTHVQITGPAALSAQLSFVKDWYWSKDKFPDLTWDAHSCDGGSQALILHTGPADEIETCLLAHVALINQATKRILLATPYFVPPEGVMDALILATLRGVEVQILLPSYSDSRWVEWASKVYIEELLKVGVKFFEYTPGFLHQKVMLIDNETAVIGSANLDSRSNFVNFEIMAVLVDKKLIADVDTMLKSDFQKSKEILYKEFVNRSFLQKVSSRAVSLLAPML